MPHYIIFLICLIAAFSISDKCNTNMPANTPIEARAFEIHGHRGCRGLMPENTWPAMRLALDLGVTALEMDVVISGDRQVLLSHEPWFNHEFTTMPDGQYLNKEDEKKYNIYKMPYAEIAKFDVGLKPHPRFPEQYKINAVKPRLIDLLDSVKAYMLTARRPFPFFNIEIKSTPETDGKFHPEPAEYVKLVMQVLQSKHLEGKLIIQSFDKRPLQYLHKNYPEIQTAYLIESNNDECMENLVKGLGFAPSVYSPNFSHVTQKLVEKCHRQKIKIIPWTVNELPEMEKLKKMGVDGIITDYPNRALSLKN